MNLTTDSTWAWRLSCSPILWMDVHSGEIKCQPKNISWFLAANLTFKFGRQTSQHFVWKLTRSFYNIRYFCCCCLVAKSCLTLCNLMDYSMPSFPVPHHLLEFAQTHVHWIGDAIQPSHPSVVPFSSHLQSFPASGSFQMSQFFVSGGQSIKSFSFSISPSKEYSGLISFRMNWLDLLAVQGTLKSLQHHSSKTSILLRSAFFIVQLSHPYMTTGKTIALTRWNFLAR